MNAETAGRGVAQRWFAAHAGQHLDADRQLMIDRCAAHLIDELAVSKRIASGLAVRAWCDHHKPAGDWRIDFERSTLTVLVLVRADGTQSLLVTVDELTGVEAPPPRWMGLDLATAPG